MTMRALLAWCLAGLFAVSLGWGWQAGRDHLLRIVRDPAPATDAAVPAPSPEDRSLVAAGNNLFDAPEAPSVSPPSQPKVESAVLSAETAPQGSTLSPVAAQAQAPFAGAPAAGVSAPPADVSGPPAGVTGPPADATAPRRTAAAHVRIGLCESLQDALDVATRAQSLGQSISLSNAGPFYQVGIAGDFDEAAAEHLVRTLRQAGFAATIIP